MSKREIEVLRLIVEGLSNLEIARELFVSLSTIKSHIRKIYGKLNMHKRTQTILKAKEMSILKAEQNPQLFV